MIISLKNIRVISFLAILCLYSCATSVSPEAQKNSESLYQLGLSAYQEGKYPDAISYLNDSLHENPNHAEAPLILGLSYVGILRPAEGVKILEKACKKNNEWAECWNNLSYAYLQNRNFKLAIQASDKALVVSTYRTPHLAHMNRAMALVELGKYGEAKDGLEIAKKFAKDDCNLRLHLARVLGRLAKPAEALQEIRFAIGKCPQNPSAHLWEAYFLHQNRRTQPSIKKFQFVIQRFPKSTAMEFGVKAIKQIENNQKLSEPPV